MPQPQFPPATHADATTDANAPLGEFALIRRYFARPSPRAVLGIGDDCALLAGPSGLHWAVSTDMLVAGRHFFPDADPRMLGHKALAVNLSDLAACGAQPQACTLALALPQADPAWLGPFSEGLLALADAHGCELIGGDTTRGPLTICITVFGHVPQHQALLRSGARAGDDVYVSGQLGDARLALEARQGLRPLDPSTLAAAALRMDQPTPRIALGMALRGVASAAADVSDGLAGDLGHILAQSSVGACLHADVLPTLLAHRTAAGTEAEALQYVLSGGDDYELVFTAPPSARAAVQAASHTSHTAVTRIGYLTPEPGLRLVDAQGQHSDYAATAFDHFLS